MNELDPRIRIRAPLRCDGIGRLDCAEDTISGERLAVRWLPLEANGDAAAKACEKLPRHPTLPRILQTGQVGTSAFVALDFPQGELLSARGEEALDQDLLLKLAAQLSDALATVHAQGVVHGEMSRDSVLMVPGGKASLWDMPLVIANRLTDRRGENRLMQNLVKTAPYLAPERAAGGGASQASDVYALGSILCIAGGSSLPTAPTTLGVVHQVSSGAWTPTVPAGLPQRWRDVIEQMISPVASGRPSARDVALAFATVPGQSALPTAPELPATKLPAEILEAAEALMRTQVESMRSGGDLTPPMSPAVEAALPVATDPIPALTLTPASGSAAVHPHTLDEVNEATPDVVRIPTMEIRAIEAEPVSPPPPPLAALPSVPLTENLSVSPELLQEGAMTLSAEEVASLKASNRRVWWVFGGVAGAVAALLIVAVVMAVRSDDVVVAPSPTPVVVAAPRPSGSSEDLAPLPQLAPRVAPKPVAARPAPASPSPARSEAAPVRESGDIDDAFDSAPAPAPAPAERASPESAEAPKSDLKRPPEF